MMYSLMYLTNTRPDIFFAMNKLRHVQLMVSKHALRYLKGTIDYGIKYESNKKINLEGYVDSDWAGSDIDRKSTSGCCFSMGSSMISWFSRKQSYVAVIANFTTHGESNFYGLACPYADSLDSMDHFCSFDVS